MTNDPFNLPLETIAEKNGVKIRVWGSGKPLVVFPGLEGSGESCLHFIVPAIETMTNVNLAVQLVLVDYSKESHTKIESLEATIENLLLASFNQQPLLVYAQSFGNLLASSIVSAGNLNVENLFMISPFIKVPRFMISIAHYSLYVTPNFLYRSMIKPMGRYVFGPTGEQNKNHPFFNALARAVVREVKRQTRWLVRLDHKEVFSNIPIPFTVLLGKKDRLVAIEKEISFFQSICDEKVNRKLVLNENNGHVIFIPEEIENAKGLIEDFLKSHFLKNADLS